MVSTPMYIYRERYIHRSPQDERRAIASCTETEDYWREYHVERVETIRVDGDQQGSVRNENGMKRDDGKLKAEGGGE